MPGAGLFDRLMRPGAAPGSDDVKACIVRDVAALLNTRAGMDLDMLDAFPAARNSLLSYGLADFAALSMGSSSDRAAMCASIERAIVAHEPRLAFVSVQLLPRDGQVNRLCFAIHARLAGGQSLDLRVVLDKAALHYEVRRAAPASALRPPSFSY